MTAQKIKIPMEKLIFKYNREYDILNIYFNSKKVAFSDEIIHGVYEHFDNYEEKLIGLSIEDYKKIDRNKLYSILSVNLDFEYIDKNVVNDLKN